MAALTTAITKLTVLMVSIAIKKVSQSRGASNPAKDKGKENMKHKNNNIRKGGHRGKSKTRPRR